MRYARRTRRSFGVDRRRRETWWHVRILMPTFGSLMKGLSGWTQSRSSSSRNRIMAACATSKSVAPPRASGGRWWLLRRWFSIPHRWLQRGGHIGRWCGRRDFCWRLLRRLGEERSRGAAFGLRRLGRRFKGHRRRHRRRPLLLKRRASQQRIAHRRTFARLQVTHDGRCRRRQGQRRLVARVRAVGVACSQRPCLGPCYVGTWNCIRIQYIAKGEVYRCANRT